MHRRSAGRAVLHGEVRIVGPDDVEVAMERVNEGLQATADDWLMLERGRNRC